MPPDPLRIVWVLTGNEGYGVLGTVVNLATAVRELGHEPLIAVVDRGRAFESLQGTGLPLRHLDVPPIATYRGGAIQKTVSVIRRQWTRRRTVEAFSAALSPLRPSVVHWLGPHLTNLLAPVAVRIGALPVWEIPNQLGASDPTGLGRRRYRSACRRHRVLVLPNSRHTATTIEGPGVRTVINYACVDDRKFNPASLADPVTKAQLGLNERTTVLGIVARLHPQKGQLEIMKAVRSMRAAGQDVALVCVGGSTDSPTADSLRGIAGDDTDCLRLVGRVDAPERYYAAIDVAVNSRIDAEPFGMSVIEAMLMERPVLAHSLGGPSETIVDGETGWLTDDPTVEGFQSGLNRAIRDRPRWGAMGRAGRARALRRFGRDVIVGRYLSAIGPGPTDE